MIINAAITVGAKKIVLSDCGTNVPEFQTTELLSEVHRGELEMRKYMESNEMEGLTWTGLVIGAFFDRSTPTPHPFPPKPSQSSLPCHEPAQGNSKTASFLRFTLTSKTKQPRLTDSSTPLPRIPSSCSPSSQPSTSSVNSHCPHRPQQTKPPLSALLPPGNSQINRYPYLFKQPPSFLPLFPPSFLTRS